MRDIVKSFIMGFVCSVTGIMVYKLMERLLGL